MHANSRQIFLMQLLALVATATAVGQTPSVPGSSDDTIKVARVDASGKLLKPADLQNWVFLGASLGMGYNPGSFNANQPGQFQVVLMEPNAYRYFTEHKTYAPGSMFLLSFYDSDQRRSINQKGFVQADMTNYEIHLLEPRKGDERHSFYLFGANDAQGSPLPAGNACVRCHVDHGAFDGTFAQFYPTIRPLIPADALERAAKDHDIR
ncbi:MAG TPA: cytochrome P460 family protein [Steroidobacteraceae bacterium]|nr:cytochrome P460 family protein [Steroidobacteraceae bacterium]